MQQRNLADIKDIYRDLAITEIPLFDREIRGIDGLIAFGAALLGNGGIHE